MEPNDLALSDVHVSEYHQKVGVLEVHTAVTDEEIPATATVATFVSLHQSLRILRQSTATGTGGSNSARSTTAGHTTQSTDNELTTDTAVCRSNYSNAKARVVSDQNIDSESYEVCRTRFIFDSDITESPNSGERTPPPLEYDEDGDIVVPRRSRDSQVIQIDHTLGTRLLHVGLQVWQGCLLLCDFILDRRAEFEGITALELGGGVGLASVVMATVAKQVICTDVGDSVLALCEKNAEANKHLYNQSQDCKRDRILIKELDWMEDSVTEGTKSEFHWRPDDMKLLDDVTVLFAADVVYDPDLTEAFLHTVTRLLSTPPHKVLYVALERRLNFTLDDLEVACPAYEHFVSCLEQLSSDGLCGVQLDSHQVEVDFPQRFEYNRTPQLVLWKIIPRIHVT